MNRYKKRGLDGNPAPFLNPISYEKPIIQTNDLHKTLHMSAGIFRKHHHID
jgi:hypothetical protein